MTKIIKRASDNAVLYAGNVSLQNNTINGVTDAGNKWIHENALGFVLEDANLPDGFCEGFAWSYNGGVWTQLDKARIDALKASNRPKKAEVPPKVTRMQARQALVIKGAFAAVQPAIDSIPDATQRQLMQIEWEDSLFFERNRPSLNMLASKIGLTSDGLDDLFILANTL